MVKLIQFLCLCLSLFLASYSRAGNDISTLVVSTDKQKLEMGKYLSVKIVYTGQNIPEPAQLKNWTQDFFVEDMDTDTEHLPQHFIKTTRTLRLYPRTSGNKVLHAIAQGGAIARPVKIMVLPVIRHNIDGTPQWLKIPSEIWQGETIKITIRQNLMSAENQVVTEQAKFPGFSIIKSWQEITTKNGISTVYINWLITAQNYGYFTLEAPSIVQRGRGRWRFYLPAMPIKVKPFPAYIPPTVPVGQLKVISDIKYIGQQPYWLITIKNHGYLAEEIYGIRSQLTQPGHHSAEQVRLIKPLLKSDDPLISIRQYMAMVPKWTLGFKNKWIEVYYFDTVTGTLKKIPIQLPSVWYIQSKWLYLFYLSAALLLLVIIFYIIKKIKYFNIRQTFKQAVKSCSTAHELRQLLLSKNHYSTLSDWAESADIPSADNIAHQLNDLCFNSASSYSLIEIKQELLY